MALLDNFQRAAGRIGSPYLSWNPVWQFPWIYSPGVAGLSAAAIAGNGDEGCRWPTSPGLDQYAEIEIIDMVWPQTSVGPALRCDGAFGGYWVQLKCWDGDPETGNDIPAFQLNHTLTVRDSHGAWLVYGLPIAMDTRGAKFRVSAQQQEDGRALVVVDLGGVEVWRGYDVAPPPNGTPGFYTETCGGSTAQLTNFAAGPCALSAGVLSSAGGTVLVGGDRKIDAGVTVAGATVGAVSYPTASSWQAAVSDLPPGSTTITATSGAESASVDAQVVTGIPVKDRSGATVTVRDRSGAAVAVKARE